MTKVKIVDYSQEQLNKLYEKYLNENKIDSLISVLNKMKKTYKNIGFIYYELGKIYFSIEMYEKAKECFFRLVDLGEKEFVLKGYNGLGACYYKLQDMALCGYYFTKQIELDNRIMLEYNHLVAEFFNDISDISKKYYLAYPYERANFSNLLDEATMLMKEGKFNEVIDLLSVIPKESRFYGNKLTQTAISKYFLEDKEGALKDIDAAINLNEKDVIPLLNGINMAFDLNEREVFDKYLKKLSDIKTFDDDENLLKSFLVYVEAGKYKNAKESGNLYLKKNPNNILIRFFMGINYLNLCDFECAKECFSFCLRVDNNYIFKSYYDLCNDEKRCYNLINKGKFNYTFDIVPAIKFEIINRLMILSCKEIFSDSEKEEILSYFNYSKEVGFQPLSIKIIEVYFKSGLKISREELKDIFLSSKVSDQFKSEIIKFLVLNKQSFKVGIVLKNLYKKITLPKYEFVGESSKIFNSAFAFACSRAVFGKLSLTKLKNNAENIFEIFKENNLTSIFDDVKSLSALMYETTDGAVINSRRDFIKYFEANAKTLKRYKESLQSLKSK